MALFFLATANTPVMAQHVADLEQWSVVTLDAHVTPKIRVALETQPRLGDNIRHLDRLLLRGAVGYQLTPTVSLWQGYAWTPSFESLHVNDQEPNEARFVSKFTAENRLFQQVLLENNWKQFKITNRTRLEERFIEGAGGTAVRARHLLRLSHPLGSGTHWSVVGYDELMINLNDTASGPQKGYDQNRIFIGLNRKLSQHASAEVGYLYNPINLPHHTTNRINHAIVATLNFKF